MTPQITIIDDDSQKIQCSCGGKIKELESHCRWENDKEIRDYYNTEFECACGRHCYYDGHMLVTKK